MNNSNEWFDELVDQLRNEPIPPVPEELAQPSKPQKPHRKRTRLAAVIAVLAASVVLLACWYFYPDSPAQDTVKQEPLRNNQESEQELSEARQVAIIKDSLDQPLEDLEAELLVLNNAIVEIREEARQLEAEQTISQILAEHRQDQRQD